MFNEGLTYITLPIEFAFAKCELTQNIPSSRDVCFSTKYSVRQNLFNYVA